MNSDKKSEKRGVLASIANIGVLFANSIGIPVERIFKSTGVSQTELMDPDSYVPNDFLLKLWKMFPKAKSGKNISLEMAKVVPFTFIGSTWRLFNMAPDLGTMMDLFAENCDLISDNFSVDQIDAETEVTIRMVHALDDYDEGIGAEVGMGIISRVARENFGEGVLSRVQFRHKARSELSVYEDYFSAPVIFEAPFNGFVIPSKALSLENKKASAKMQISIEKNFSFLRRELRAEGSDGLESIRRAITRQIKKGDFSVNGLAKNMAMGVRSLQRQVRKSGTSAKALIEETRYHNAMELMEDLELNLEDVAFQLGFDSDRSFRRAFKRWAGKSPAQARKELFED